MLKSLHVNLILLSRCTLELNATAFTEPWNLAEGKAVGNVNSVFRVRVLKGLSAGFSQYLKFSYVPLDNLVICCIVLFNFEPVLFG